MVVVVFLFFLSFSCFFVFKFTTKCSFNIRILNIYINDRSGRELINHEDGNVFYGKVRVIKG